MRQAPSVSRRNLLQSVSSAILISSLVGCRHLAWWKKEDPEQKPTYKSPNHDEEEQMGKIRNGESNEKAKKNKDSFFMSETAKEIDANLGGTR